MVPNSAQVPAALTTEHMDVEMIPPFVMSNQVAFRRKALIATEKTEITVLKVRYSSSNLEG